MRPCLAVFASFFVCACALSGEIIIQPAGQGTRNEKALDRTMDKARQHAGKQAAPVVIENGMVDRGNNAERSSRDAQDYLRPAVSQPQTDENLTIILRNAPPSESEKSRQKAAAYLQPSGSSSTSRCGEVALTVGTIGDQTVVDRNVKTSVTERGNSAINVNCR